MADVNLITNDRYDNTLISGTSGDDSIYNRQNYVTIEAGAGNDTIDNRAGGQVSISAGAGNDYILEKEYNSGIGSEINTINAGTGDDTIGYDKTNSTKSYYNYRYYPWLLQYANGDGNDIVNGFSENDTIQLLSGNIDNISGSGDDVTIKIGTGSIKLRGAKDTIISVQDADSNYRAFLYNGNNTIEAMVFYSVKVQKTLISS